MSMMTVTAPRVEAATGTRLVEVVVPVHNEQRVLAESVRRLHSYLARTFPYGFRITIADNASTDGTWGIAAELERELPCVRAVRLDRKGRGRALRKVWSESDADVVSYMDVDLSTDLDAFFPLVAPLLSGHSDLAIGSRLSRSSNVTRGPKRELISRAYNLLLRSLMGARFSDAQCGFKAARTQVAQALLPVVEDQEWFFDTELLLLAESRGLRIHEVPVDWVDTGGWSFVVLSRTDFVPWLPWVVLGLTAVAVPGLLAGASGRKPGGGQVGTGMIEYLKSHQGGATWLVAVDSAQSASSIILSTGEAVIAMGGFTGSDPAMTVAELEEYVSGGQLKYILIGGGDGPRGTDSSVTEWVKANGTLVDASDYGGTDSGGQSLYRLG
ncbi:dolichyl-phosphate beta-glucosyltransferase [Nonomuraea sp. NPDC005650]|uniref:dolichyl-phosphate beta-glucosyltransferase n=1 Tax=Nonomuraea sp. NPDC005650 TaxID=3157045 RepID=UPI0033B4EDF2